MGIFSPILKNIKGKGKDKESYIFIVYTIFNIDWWGCIPKKTFFQQKTPKGTVFRLLNIFL